ncbi:N-acetylmuramoyl-L-alanine amidase [Mycobacterium sp. SM1]|uniref:N-acetylmuramoyl-L-alanine amidase n=1 Tax=Mycobacterium sp. SM1 TaxID=2816243 RepID=UPI001BCEA78E|nr:N-acetylmuramoyl-L-alanine amidase [Mycobacterium sp. SM1]MBS4728121.1 N-acetylmuramoyl-L-alanine amidase [Mycobacterium sp. SM1]
MSGSHHRNGDALRCGDRSAVVAEIRRTLIELGLLDNSDDDLAAENRVAPDVFDVRLDRAVRAFQQDRGLLVDGVVGEATYRALKEASYRLGARPLYHQFGAPLYGDDVAALQARLQDLGFYTGLVDGYFGLQTHNALMAYQREYGLYADGICGPETLRSLYFLSSRVTGGSPHAIREEELVRRSGPKLSGKRIIIDPGRGGSDGGLITPGPTGPVSEANVLWDIASRLEGRMTAIGMETFLSRPINRSPSDAERAATANAVGADLMISLRCATLPSPAANGVASFYFGNSHGSVSTIGRNLADFIQRELVARTGLCDCRTHGRTWDLLRLTRMPTVQIDVGYITNPGDRALLVRPETRDAIAEGILAAVKRLYLLGKNDRPTGTFTFAELLAHELAVEQTGRRHDPRAAGRNRAR